ncbi:hypothetical protein CYMTET_33467 [Cymbomonas tetramitiformis]|uniref:Uncharacterized protein n=1 Tax=Cymbomonas tetramitiformis TaxID=36881 RepID=A0AAE0FDK5_9CHLO|nr:hypothetical protein CYMTET_33467 [Cymbomonas tetramitiformis]
MDTQQSQVENEQCRREFPSAKAAETAEKDEDKESPVPEYILRAIYPERYKDATSLKSKSDAYAESLHNVHECKKETYKTIILPFLEEQRKAGVRVCAGELGST